MELTNTYKPLRVAVSYYAGNWYKAGIACYQAMGVEVVEVRFTLTAEEIGLPANTDMKLVNQQNPEICKQVDWELLEQNRTKLHTNAVRQMSNVDMLYLAGGSYEFNGNDAYTWPNAEIPDPSNRKDPRIFAFRSEIEAVMIEIAQQRWLPFWGVCAAHQKVAQMNGAKLHPYVNGALADQGRESELHKIDIPNPDGGKNMGYGDITENAKRLAEFNTPRTFGDDTREISMMQRSVHWTERARTTCFPKLIPMWLQRDIIKEDVMRGDADFLSMNPPRYNAFHAMHRINVVPGTMLESFYVRAGINTDQIVVNSSHYQSSDEITVNPNIVSARSPQGIVEAIELPKDYAFGFFPLFHPETNVDGIAATIIAEKIAYAMHLNDKLGKRRQDVGQESRITYPEFVLTREAAKASVGR